MELIKQQENNVTHVHVSVQITDQLSDRLIPVGSVEQVDGLWCACFYRNNYRIISHCREERDAIIYMVQYAVAGGKISTDEYHQLWNVLFPEDAVVIR
jgi:hypothetical protein